MAVSVCAPQMPVQDLPFEVVERRGAGHPDTLCDAIADEAARREGAPAARVVLLGGASRVGLGSGELVEPYRVRADALDAAAHILARTLRGFDPEHHLAVLDDARDHPPAPVPTVSTAFAPLTDLERLVLAAERFLTSMQDAEVPTGLDADVVGTRRGEHHRLAVTVSFIGARLGSPAAYEVQRQAVEDALRDALEAEADVPLELTLNPYGMPYLTVTGSSADLGVVGVAGRGNRASGLITPMRPSGPQASETDPYNLLAQQIADAIYATAGIRNDVALLPGAGDVLVVPRGTEAPDLEAVEDVVAEAFGRLDDLTRELLAA